MRGWHTAGGNDPTACGMCEGGEIWESGCPDCGGSGEMPVGVTRDFDSGMWECDDVIPCPRCRPEQPSPNAERAPVPCSPECPEAGNIDCALCAQRAPQPEPRQDELEAVETAARALALRGGYREDELREGVETYRRDAEAVIAALDAVRRPSVFPESSRHANEANGGS